MKLSEATQKQSDEYKAKAVSSLNTLIGLPMDVENNLVEQFVGELMTAIEFREMAKSIKLSLTLDVEV